MASRLKIFHKGLILVSVPLAVELIFIGVLVVMLKHADEATQREAKCREIVAETNNMSKSFFDVATALVGYKYTHSKMFSGRYNGASGQIPDIFRRLEELTTSDPEQAQHVAKMKDIGKKILDLTKNFTTPDSSAGMMFALDAHSYREQVEGYYDNIVKEASALVQQAKVLEDPAKVEASRQAVLMCLTFGVLFNLGVTFVLSAFFYNSVVRRLSVLSDNNRRMEEKQALNDPMTGDDEIADVDQAFHKMVDALSLAERQKQEFVSMISHDLRTPLTSLNITLELIGKGKFGALTEKGQSRVRDLVEEVERLIRLINELLDIQKIQSGFMKLNLSDVSLLSVIDSAVTAVNSLAEVKGVVIVSPKEDVRLWADADRLVQVVQNLVSNAIKYSPDNARITIAIETLPRSIRVTISDQGRGIPNQQLDKIFEPYQQVYASDSSPSRGTGLGLTVCKQVIEAHDGTIGVESKVGAGSTFWFVLPLRAKSVSAASI
jgi:signal transduction histidine kinase